MMAEGLIKSSNGRNGVGGSETGKSSSKSGAQKAKEYLKKAIKTGKIEEALWGKEFNFSQKSKNDEIGNNHQHSPQRGQHETSILPKSPVEQRRIAMLDDFRKYLEDAKLMDDVAIWNRVLMSRVLHSDLTDAEKENHYATLLATLTASGVTGSTVNAKPDSENDLAESEKDDTITDMKDDVRGFHHKRKKHHRKEKKFDDRKGRGAESDTASIDGNGNPTGPHEKRQRSKAIQDVSKDDSQRKGKEGEGEQTNHENKLRGKEKKDKTRDKEKEKNGKREKPEKGTKKDGKRSGTDKSSDGKKEKESNPVASSEGLQQPTPGSPSFGSTLRNFDVLPVLDKNQSYYMGVIRKPKRVSQIIKDAKNFQLMLKAKQQDSSDTDTSTTSDTDGTPDSSSGGSYHGLDDDSSLTSEFYDRFDMDGSGTRWGGTTNTTTIYSGRSRNSKIRKSIDVVAGLFQMSNELREERESIMTRTSKDGSNNNMEAFLNRETTLKYNDELEEVAQSKQDSIMTQRRAALLRIRKNAMRYRTYKSSNAERFSTLWEQMKPYRKIVIEHDTRLGESDSQEDSDGGGGSNEDDSTMKRSSNLNKNSSIINNTEHDSTIGLSHKSSHTSLHTQSENDSKFSGGPPNGNLESIFEQDLNLLFATKVRATTYNSKKSRPPSVSSVVSGVGGLLTRRLPGGGMKMFNPADFGLLGSSDENDGDDGPNADPHSSRSLSTIASTADVRSNALRMANQKNLNAIIEKMKAMGVYSDSRFNRRSASMSASSDPLDDHRSKKRKNSRELAIEGSSSFSQSKDPYESQGIAGPMSKWLQSNEIDDLKAKEKYLESLKAKLSNLSSRTKSESMDGGEEAKKDYGTLTEHSTAATENSSNYDGSVMSNMDDSVFSRGNDMMKHSGIIPPHQQAFLTQQLVGIDVNTENSTHLSEDMMHRLGNKGPNLLPPEPTTITPLIVAASTRPGTRDRMETLQGRWNYDSTLEERSPSAAECKLERVKLKIRNNKRNNKRRKRQVLHLPERKDYYKEIVFNADTCQLCLLMKEGEKIIHCVAVDLDTVYITDGHSPHDSAAVNEIIVRTTDLEQVKSGYLGAFPLQQWISIEEEMNQSLVQLITAKKERARRIREQRITKSNFQNSSNNNAKNLISHNNGNGLHEMSLVSALTNEDSASVQRLQIENDHQQLREVSFLDNTKMMDATNANVEHDHVDVKEKYFTIPRYSVKRDDLPCLDPPVHTEQDMQIKRQIMMTFQSNKLRFSPQKRTQMLIEKAMKTVRVNKPHEKVQHIVRSRSPSPSPAPQNKISVQQPQLSTSIEASTISEITERTAEPNRYRDLLPTIVAKHWSKKKSAKLAGQENDVGEEVNTFASVLAERGTIYELESVSNGSDWQSAANSLTLSELQQLKDSTFNLANQVIPLAPTPPILQPAVKNHGYDASGFSACNQTVSFTIKGFSPSGSMFSPSKPSNRSGATNKSFRTNRLSAAFSESSLLSSSYVANDSFRQEVKQDVDKPIGTPQRLAPMIAEEVEVVGSIADENLQPVVIPRTSKAAIAARIEAKTPDAHNAPSAVTPPSPVFDEISDNAVAPPVPEKLRFSYEYQIILLVESRRIMQLYFAKKFLQLDLAVNVHLTPYDATESLLDAPDIYGLIFISYVDLQNFGVEKTLKSIIPPELDKMKYSIVVYDVGNEDDDELALLESYGVSDVLYPPYTIAALKAALDAHQCKQEIRLEFVGEESNRG